MLTLENLARLWEEHGEEPFPKVREFSLKVREFKFNQRPSVMGVVNLSPDSWYRESVALSVEAAVERGRVLSAQGAELIDLGAESTLAHAARVSSKRQQSKLIPVIEELARENILLSIETYSPAVARVVLQAGAAVINLTGTVGTRAIFHEVAAHDAAVILCYVQGKNVRNVDQLQFERDPIDVMYEYFARYAEKASQAGVEKIFIDPGLGFYYRNLQDSGARVRHQMSVFLNSFRLRKLGWPVCHALPHAFEFFKEEVRSAEGFFAVLAALGKTDLFRTHEVARVRAVLETLRAFDGNSKSE